MPDVASRLVRIDRNEWWPVYTIEYLDGDTRVPESLIERYELCAAEFSEIQDLLSKEYHRGR